MIVITLNIVDIAGYSTSRITIDQDINLFSSYDTDELTDKIQNYIDEVLNEY